MIVVMTSLAPNRARRTPAIPPQIAPPIAPATRHNGISTTAGRCSAAPATAVHRPPATSCPSAPMLKRPARNATATPSPAKSNAVVWTSVSAKPCFEPNAPRARAPNASIGLAWKASMTNDDTRSASASAPIGPAACRSASRNGTDSRHAGAELGVGRGLRCEFARDPAFAEDDDAVGERADLVKIERDQHDARSAVADVAQPSMDDRRGADIDAAGRGHADQQPRVVGHLAADDQFLLRAAGICACRLCQVESRQRIARVDLACRTSPERKVETHAATRAPLVSEQRIFGGIEVEHEPFALPVRRNVADARDPSRSCGEP